MENQYIETVTNSFLANKLGISYQASPSGIYNTKDLSERIRAEMDSLDFEMNPDYRMRVYEKLGGSSFEGEEDMLNHFNSGVSFSAYMHSDMGLKLAKTECINSDFEYLGNMLIRNEDKLHYMKGGFPLFFMGKKKKSDYKRLLNKINKIKDILADKKNSIEDKVNEYGDKVNIVTLDPDEKVRVFKMLPEDHVFYFVNTQRYKVIPVKAVPYDCRTFIIHENTDINISYAFVSNNNEDVAHFMADSPEHLDSKEIPCNVIGQKIFWNKEDAIAYIKEKMDNSQKQYHKMLSGIL